MGWTVVYNHLGAVAEEMPRAINKGVQDVMDLLDQGLSIDNHLSAVQDALEKSETLASL